jgi:methanogenic corrinoid protein MtbC1
MTPSSAADLTGLIVEMDERASLSAIRERLAAGEDPRTLMEECRAGMEQVGKMYESGEYFVSALIMAGEIFRQADIHDIGKNIAVTLLEARGFTVVDLGVDVHPELVADAVVAERPDVLGLSCLLTTGFETLRETIELARERAADREQRLPVVIGGTAIDQHTAEYVSADGWCTDAADGIAVVHSLLS